jgi:hypothetical protein
MKTTVRGPVFETNSSSEHTFIHMSKNTFEAWKRREKIFRSEVGSCIGEADFIDAEEIEDWEKDDEYGWDGTYEGVLKWYSCHGGECVARSEAKKEYVDPKEWDREDYYEDDAVFQNPFMEVIDNGRTVTIHIWGRRG